MRPDISADPLGLPQPCRTPAERSEPARPRPAAAGADLDQLFWKMWIEHHAPLRKMLLRMTRGNMAEAEDVLGNAMIKAFHQYRQVGGAVANERAWLSRLVRNVCIDHYRSGQRLARWIEDTVRDEILSLRASPQGVQEPTPEERLEASQAIRELEELITAMPETLRRPLVMRFLEDMGYDEIAQALDLTNCAVRKRIQLARDFLRKGGKRGEG